MSGFELQVIHNVEYDDIFKAAWFRNFEREGFDRFSIEPYGNGELIISAHYKDGKHWVAGFAVPSDHEFAQNWRYQEGTT